MRCDAMRYGAVDMPTVAMLRASRTLIYLMYDHAIVVATALREVKINKPKPGGQNTPGKQAVGDGCRCWWCRCRCGDSRRAGRMPIDIEWERAAINRISSASTADGVGQFIKTGKGETGELGKASTLYIRAARFPQLAPNKKRPSPLPQ